jgi:chemotaxis protein MotB
MSDDANPFSKKAPAPDPVQPNARPAMIAAVILGALLIVALILWAVAVADARRFAALPAKLEEANASLTNALAENAKAREQIADLQAQVADLEKEKDQVGMRAKGLEDEMRSDLESRDVTISNLKGKLTVNILDRVMFDSGEAVLKPDGESVLRKIASILAEHPELKIQVIGHTDNVPIRSRFPSNWELSVARALAAVHFLTDSAGVDPRRLGAAGYGEYRPIAENSTAEGRARNRRIAITILPDELAAADAPPPSPKATAPTNVPSAAPDSQ